jgi:glycogen(starch) synthase
MAQAGIYALPARYEPFGLSVLEAALSGCALVLGGIDSLQELWDDAACYVPPGDVDALAATITTLAGDDHARVTLAARARTRARERTPERMAAAYRDLYQEVLR